MNEATQTRPWLGRFDRVLFFRLAIAISVSLLPTVIFGWKGIPATVLLAVASVFVWLNKRPAAITTIVLLLLGYFFYPAIDGAREAILRSECKNNLHRLTYAILDYESKYGHFPPPFTMDSGGNRLHSWRVSLLPYLGEQALYDQIDKTRPWDDPVNIPFHNQMPEVFCCAALKYHSRWRTTGNTTSYIVVIGDHSPWQTDPPRSFSSSPGIWRNIAIIESESNRLPWMAPNDPDLQQFLDGIDYSRPHGGTIHCSCFDGSVVLTRDIQALQEQSIHLTLNSEVQPAQ